MKYQIKIDGEDVFDFDENHTLRSPVLQMELNAAGSLEFTMTANHINYDLPKILTSDVEVWEDGSIIWFGRIVEIEVDIYNQKKIYCEGALAYFNDTIQRPYEYDSYSYNTSTGDSGNEANDENQDTNTNDVIDSEGISIKDFFEILISNHNKYAPSNRQFTVGVVEIADFFVYRKLDYETTFEALKKMCLDAEGGYLVTRKENGINYIDWVKEVTGVSDQPIEFAVNLQDISQIMDYKDFKTAVIPIGEENENGVKATCIDENHTEDYLTSEAADTYGKIFQVVQFSGLTLPQDLYEAGEKWLKDKQWNNISIEVEASDLSYLSDDYTSFKMGQNVHCTSTPNLIDKTLPIVKMQINLDSTSKQLTIGTIKHRDLTEIYKEN